MNPGRVEDCYRLLDLRPGASREEIRKTYLLLVNVWHPDRFVHAPELQAKAHEKLQAINGAFETIQEAPLGRAPSAADGPVASSPPAAASTGPAPRTPAEWLALGRRLTASPGRLRPDGEGLVWSNIGNLSQYLEGLRAFREALRLDPGFAEAWYGLGLAHLGLREYDGAISAFEEAVRLRRDHAPAWLSLGAAYAERGLDADAAESFREVVRLRPRDAAAWYALGSACERAGSHEEAVRAHRAAVRLNPDLAEAWFALGVTLAFSGPDGRVEPEEALGAFREAVRLKPDLVEAWCRLGATLSGLRRHDEAVEVLRQAVRLKPESVEAWFSLGVAARYSTHKGSAQTVREAYSYLKRLSPGEASRLRELLPYSLRLSLMAFLPRVGDSVAAEGRAS